MKLLNGFGKKYFSLSSIQAYSVAIILHNIAVSCKNHLQIKFQESLLSCKNSKQYFHCDCFFRRKTALAVRLFKYIPRCPFYCTFFAFRRTGVHPPLISFSIN